MNIVEKVIYATTFANALKDPDGILGPSIMAPRAARAAAEAVRAFRSDFLYERLMMDGALALPNTPESVTLECYVEGRSADPK